MSSDPSDPDLEAGLRAEWRAERRATEHEALRDMWSQRRLVDVFHEALRRGDEVVVHCHPRRLHGQVVDAGRDYAVVDTGRQHVTVRAVSMDSDDRAAPYLGPPVRVEIPKRARRGGRQASHPSSTFRSVLHHFDFQAQLRQKPVELGVAGRRDPLEGWLRALGTDHLYLCDRDDVEVFVPLSTVGYVAWADLG